MVVVVVEGDATAGTTGGARERTEEGVRRGGSHSQGKPTGRDCHVTRLNKWDLGARGGMELCRPVAPTCDRGRHHERTSAAARDISKSPPPPSPSFLRGGTGGKGERDGDGEEGIKGKAVVVEPGEIRRMGNGDPARD